MRQRFGVHFQDVRRWAYEHKVAIVHHARQTDAERVYRELQCAASEGMPQRELVSLIGRGSSGL